MSKRGIKRELELVLETERGSEPEEKLDMDKERIGRCAERLVENGCTRK